MKERLAQALGAEAGGPGKEHRTAGGYEVELNDTFIKGDI